MYISIVNGKGFSLFPKRDLYCTHIVKMIGSYSPANKFEEKNFLLKLVITWTVYINYFQIVYTSRNFQLSKKNQNRPLTSNVYASRRYIPLCLNLN